MESRSVVPNCTVAGSVATISVTFVSRVMVGLCTAGSTLEQLDTGTWTGLTMNPDWTCTLADMDWTGNGLAMDSGWTVHHWQHSGPVGIRIVQTLEDLNWTDNRLGLNLHSSLWNSWTLVDLDWTDNGQAMDPGWTVHHWQHSGTVQVGLWWTRTGLAMDLNWTGNGLRLDSHSHVSLATLQHSWTLVDLDWIGDGLGLDWQWTWTGLVMDSDWTGNGLRLDLHSYLDWTGNGLRLDFASLAVLWHSWTLVDLDWTGNGPRVDLYSFRLWWTWTRLTMDLDWTGNGLRLDYASLAALWHSWTLGLDWQWTWVELYKHYQDKQCGAATALDSNASQIKLALTCVTGSAPAQSNFGGLGLG
ncbi:hypothetical protein B0H21DRAFT_708326 [Amylocystis lapponica]|nr:hypothetical protein B0H21DRAFT_708326 [Amylocystis lapponica]